MALHDGGLSLDGLMKYYADAIALARESQLKEDCLESERDALVAALRSAIPYIRGIAEMSKESPGIVGIMHDLNNAEAALAAALDKKKRDVFVVEQSCRALESERNRLREQLAEREEQCILADANAVKWQDRFEALEKESKQAVAAERERVVGVIEKEYLSFRRRGFEAGIAFWCAMGKVRRL